MAGKKLSNSDRLKSFENLRDRTDALMHQFGEPDYQPNRSHGDYSVHGDFGGYPELVVFVGNLEMLKPVVVNALQNLVRDYPGWQITITVAVRDHYDDWPDMGLYIRPHEIIDGLQRKYFPERFQSLAYEGARRGTASD